MSEVFLVIIALSGAVFVHEMAHVVVGLSLGWQCHHISVGPIKVSHRPGAGWSMTFIKSPYKWGGAVALTPKTESMVNKRQLIIVIGAGPVISFIAALLLFLIPSSEIFPWIFLALALITGTPYRGGNVYSDGGKIRQLLKSHETAEVELAITRMGVHVFTDGNLSNVSSKDIEVLMKSDDIRDRYRGTYYMRRYYMDLGLEEEASKVKEKLDELSRELPISLKRQLRKFG